MMVRSSATHAWLLAAAYFGSGCSPELSRDQPPPRKATSALAGGPVLDKMSDQGEHLQDTSMALGNSFGVLSSGATDADGAAFDSVVAQGGQIVATRAGQPP